MIYVNPPPEAWQPYQNWLLMAYAAEHLAGEPVILRRQALIFNDCNALTWKSPEGQIRTDIDSHVLDEADLFRILTHEAAHARLHVRTLQPSTEREHRADLQPAARFSDLVTGKAVMELHRKRESEADALAERFRAFALAHEKDAIYPAWLAPAYIPSLTQFQRRLFALLRYRESQT